MSQAHAARPPRVVARSRELPRLSGPAWGAVALAAAFVALTWWWLTQDRAVLGTEPGSGISTVIDYRAMLREGHLLLPLTTPTSIYPPLTFTLGALATLVGGVGVIAPVLAQNLVYVPLLALGCYQTAKLVGGPSAGLLAVAFALGAPLVIEQFHVFMLEVPEAALTAVAVWLILASDRFARRGHAAAAGLAVGLGLMSKQQFPTFLVGLVIVVLARERGWRNWRGLGLFALVALAVGGPWYAIHLTHLGAFNHGAIATAKPGTLPQRLSESNLEWYLWASLNALLYAPLAAFAAIGVTSAAAGLLRRRPARHAPELLGGLLGAWLVLLVTPIHVTRYTVPLIVYLAVLGTAWIVRLRPAPRALASGALALAVAASTLGATFGVGGRVALRGHGPDRTALGIPLMDQVVLYGTRAFIVSGPRRDGDLLGLLRALKHAGAERVAFMPEQEEPLVYDSNGVVAFAAIAGLGVPGLTAGGPVVFSDLPPRVALLLRARSLGSAPPCTRLSDGTGIWVRFGRALAADARDDCPYRDPPLYGP